MFEKQIAELQTAFDAKLRLHGANIALDTLVLAKRVTLYCELGPLLGLHQHSSTLWGVLNCTFKEDWKKEKAARCSLIVNKAMGMPGNSYYETARSLGVSLPTRLDEYDFWVSQLDALGVPAPTLTNNQLKCWVLHLREAGETPPAWAITRLKNVAPYLFTS